MANKIETREFDFKFCPWCSAVYLEQQDLVGTRSNHLGASQVMIKCHQCGVSYVADRAIIWRAQPISKLVPEVDKQPRRTTAWQNLKGLIKLMLPTPPWAGPPLSRAFGVTWGMVLPLLTGRTGIIWV